VSKSGSRWSFCLTRSGISVQPRMMPCAPRPSRRTIILLNASREASLPPVRASGPTPVVRGDGQV